MKPFFVTPNDNNIQQGLWFFSRDTCQDLNEHHDRKVFYLKHIMKFRPENYYETIEEEREAMQKFIKKNMFPKWFADYKYIHYARGLYENICNEDVVRKIGQELWNRTKDFRAMQTLHYFMTNISPLSICGVTIAWTRATIANAWDGVGPWRA